MSTLEINEQFIPSRDTIRIAEGAALMVTPPLDEDYWLFRVQLFQDQAILGFPKFTVIGIGFAQEEASWNTNLPSTCDAQQIYDHIHKNKLYDEITEEQCLEAIRMIQEAAKELMSKEQ